MVTWKQAIDLTAPPWVDFTAQLDLFDDRRFPSPSLINQCLSADIHTQSGHQVQFVNSDSLDSEIYYEQRIFETGVISTRPGSFHDLFNALAWSRYPKIKSAINAVHCREIAASPGNQRSGRRDALTLFDECGVIIVSPDSGRLDQIASHDWQKVYRENSSEWGNTLMVFVFGHGLLEKYLEPYKAITAQALLVHHRFPSPCCDRDAMISLLDTALSEKIHTGGLLTTSRDHSAVPLAGIPGWWPEDEIDDVFFADEDVFRPLGNRRPAAPVHQLRTPGITGLVD